MDMFAQSGCSLKLVLMSTWKPTTCPVPCLPVSPHTFDISLLRLSSMCVFIFYPSSHISVFDVHAMSYMGVLYLYSSGWGSPGGGKSTDPTWSWGEWPTLRVRLVLSTPGRIQGELSLATTPCQQLSYTFSYVCTLLAALQLEYQSNKTRLAKAHITSKTIFHLKNEVFCIRPIRFKVSQSLWMITELAHIYLITHINPLLSSWDC